MAVQTTSLAKKEYTKKVYSILNKAYPRAHIVLNYSNSWELLVAVILSAQCTDKRVNIVTKSLFSKYKSVEDYARAEPSEFEKDIRSTGFYKNKAKNIIAAAKRILTTYKGEVPRTMDEMLTIPGVARKTANVVLGNAYGIVEGIAVDTHVLRNSQRLRLVDPNSVSRKKKPMFIKNTKKLDYYKDADPVKVEKELMKVVPQKDWFKFTYLLVDHGRALCRAQNPECVKCPLQKICPVSRTRIS